MYDHKKINIPQNNLVCQSKRALKQSEEIRYVILWLNLDLSQLRPLPNSLKRKLYKRANDEGRYEKSDVEPFTLSSD